MKFNTSRFGEIDIQEDRIFEFSTPIIGFDLLKKFAILDFKQDGIFKWLQSTEDSSVAFPLVSMYTMNTNYSIDLPDTFVELLDIKNVESLLIMNIASIPHENPHGTTVNLLAPIIFNLDNMKAGQVILTGSGYDVSFPLFKKD